MAHRLTSYLLLAALVVGSGVAIGVGLSEAPTSTLANHKLVAGHKMSQVPPLTASLVLPATKVKAGAVVTGRITVENRTGASIRVLGCHDLYLVLLGNSSYRPSPGFELCQEYLTVPTGRSVYKVLLRATYNECTEAGGTNGLGFPPCTATGLPPVPVGGYEAITFAAASQLPVPAPVTVQVIAP